MLKIARSTKDLVFEGKTHSRAYWQGQEVWRKMHRINVDHGQSLDGVLEGVYDRDKKGFLVEEPDVLAPVITLNPDLENVTLKYNESFTIPQATVTDNKDPKPSLEIEILKDGQIVSDIDTKIPGDYEIIYTARDSSGNEAKKVLPVKVANFKDGKTYRNLLLNRSDVKIDVSNTLSGYDKIKILDGDKESVESRWVSQGGGGHFLKLTFPNEVLVEKIVFFTGYNMSSFISATEILTDGKRIGNYTINAYKKEITIPATICKEIKFNFPDDQVRVYEVEIYGY